MKMGREKEVFGESFMLYSVWAMVRGGIAPAGGLFFDGFAASLLVPGTTPVNFDEGGDEASRQQGPSARCGRCFSAP